MAKDPKKIVDKAFKKQLDGKNLESLNLYKSLIKMSPSEPAKKTIFYNMGLCYMGLGKWQDAITFFNRSNAIEQDPANCWNKSLCHLNLLQWEEGMGLYNNRYRDKSLKNGVKFPDFPIPQFFKSEEWKGKKVLVMNEQGLGDELMFSTQFRKFSSLVGSAVIKTSEENVTLFKYIFGDIKNLEFKSFDSVSLEDIQSFDGFIPSGDIFSELYEFGNSISLSRYKSIGQTEIGLCWEANAASPNHKLRSLKYEDFNFIREEFRTQSIQYGKDNFRPNDMLETWNRIITLHSCVTIDTSVAHLCGIIGIPTILVINRHFDWRWKYRNESGMSLFYPSVKPIQFENLKHEINQLIK